MNLDEMRTHDILKTMNQEDRSVPDAVNQEMHQIERAVSLVIDSFERGGRLVYIGAGTSGRLGVLDAAECPPTFGTNPELVQGLIAGGEQAIKESVEDAEDNPELAAEDLRSIELGEKDTIIGLAASGRTPYVIGGLDYGLKVGASTVAVSCNKNVKSSEHADVAIEVETGPEILTGSTRLKAGTAQKLVLNMISTASMVGIGKVYENLMVDVQLTNQKLVHRAKNIVALAAQVDEDTAESYLEQADNNPKLAIVMAQLQCSYEQARDNLAASGGFVRQAINLTNRGGESNE